MLRKILLLAALVVAISVNAFAADQKVYKCAGHCVWPPMEYLDANKKPQGFDVAMVAEIAKTAGIKFEFIDCAWDGIFAGLAGGNYDMLASGITITEERKKVYLFSDPYYEVHQAVVMPKGKSIKSLDDLKTLKVGGQIGTTGIFVLDKAKIKAKEYDDIGLAMEDLKAGKIDAAICDSNVAAYYASVKADFKGVCNVVFKTPDVEYLGLCFNKKDAKLQQMVNAALDKMRKNGKLAELTKKWCGE